MSKVAVVTVAVAAVVAQGVWFAPATYATKSDKVTICHATNSQSNPYVKISVNSSSIQEANHVSPNGHGTHEGGVWRKGVAAHSWGDIIPAFESPEGNTYPGMNWTDEGKAVYGKGCTIVAVSTGTQPFDKPARPSDKPARPSDKPARPTDKREEKKDCKKDDKKDDVKPTVPGKGGVKETIKSTTPVVETTSVVKVEHPEATPAAELPRTGPLQSAALLGSALSGATYLVARKLQKK